MLSTEGRPADRMQGLWIGTGLKDLAVGSSVLKPHACVSFNSVKRLKFLPPCNPLYQITYAPPLEHTSHM
jgi:hypothetical protein